MSYEFPREVLKIVVAQICHGFDFKAIEQSAHDTLTDILAAYIEELGYNAHIAAEHSCRSESNFYDVSYALELMGSNVDQLLLFYKKSDEIPFPRGIPAFPMASQPPNRGVIRDNEPPRPPHIPKWLPPFPDARTYKSTPVFASRDTTAKTIRAEKEKNRQYMENNLAHLHQRSSGLLGNQDIVNYDQVRDIPRAGAQQDASASFLRPRKEIDLDDSAMDVDQDGDAASTPAFTSAPGDVPVIYKGKDGQPSRVEKVVGERMQTQIRYSQSSSRRAPGSPTSPRDSVYNADHILNLEHAPDGITAIDGSVIAHKVNVPSGPGAPASGAPARKP
eukprot:TRINITY_DN6189_c0_g1_i1.p1 TRINITY_DN6189_c0_g1~~TRINITY_DN6189_c0_g1_i1.p1  ORF type:complete len:333 (-),score=54.60 TRINITY_DN6189_c0_g1_i1:37-1035(-)